MEAPRRAISSSGCNSCNACSKGWEVNPVASAVSREGLAGNREGLAGQADSSPAADVAECNLAGAVAAKVAVEAARAADVAGAKSAR